MLKQFLLALFGKEGKGWGNGVGDFGRFTGCTFPLKVVLAVILLLLLEKDLGAFGKVFVDGDG